MRVYTKAGDLAFSTFTFPDGQPHFILETYGREFPDATIELAIRNPVDLFQLLAATDVLHQGGYSVSVDIRYLLGARMDRAIDHNQPFTLGLVARLLNGAGFNRVRLLDVHSEAALRLVRASVNLLPLAQVKQVRQTLGDPRIIIPDKGATERVMSYLSVEPNFAIQCEKVRDMATGKLSGFKVPEQRYVDGKDCLIIDDICDGGGTFVGLAKELRKAGAKSVNLFVTHGIFSKGFPLDGIDKVFTTDSFRTQHEYYCADPPIGKCNYFETIPSPAILPVSMRDLK